MEEIEHLIPDDEEVLVVCKRGIFLLEDIDYAGVAAYLGDAADAKVNLFI
nr:hypothetical protein [Paenibacillus sp. YPD9-1]